MMVPRAPEGSGGCSRGCADGRHSRFQVCFGIDKRPVERTPMPGITARPLALDVTEDGRWWHDS
jgi:hypothetical protein